MIADTDTDTDTSVVNPTRRPQPTNLQNLVTIMEPKSVLPHSRVELRRWFDSHKVGDCVAERGSGSTSDPLEALVTPLVIRPSVIKL